MVFTDYIVHYSTDSYYKHLVASYEKQRYSLQKIESRQFETEPIQKLAVN